ncbi:hypothetical protein OCK74_14950 [Chitinophagaceae bacterium LB-8]|uniref:Uncharacterized protein n=1 Tax=Paraflavisolibacter caeni TaxID=2982496 RepID=A0A9X3BHZ1_9BACT|nr:hypothetical protein [Paraflavisolibacter caeni]MCU7550417.1 hypothetical protein [Paraflavisolibacter caeni]
MARKVYYSKPLKYFWQHLYRTQKKFTPDFTDDQIFTLLRRNILAAPMGAFETPESRSLVISGLELWRDDYKGELLHIFFLDKQLRDFLEKTPLSDLDGIKKFLYENGQSKDVIHLYSKEQFESVVYRFALHLPYEADGYAFSLSLENDGSVELYFSLGENGGRMSDKFYADVNKKGDEVSLTLSKMFRLAINTIAYMNCFPDCVADGVPKNLFERSEDKSARNFTFQLSEKIRDIDNSQLSKIPHFRKGHFRLLQSDYFVNKKGQIIFVAEAMVKGKAKTVSMSPETDDFSSNAASTNN